MTVLKEIQESGFAAACGAAFEYAIAVPEGQVGGRYYFFCLTERNSLPL